MHFAKGYIMSVSSEWILQHGWGLTHRCWEKWRDFLPSDISLKMLDRGYFGQPKPVAGFDPAKKKKVLVVYSLGLHLLPHHFFQKADALVIIGSFKHYHPKQADLKAQSEAEVLQLVKDLEEDHVKGLKTFYEACYFPHDMKDDYDPAQADKKLLIEDLKFLNVSTFDLNLLTHIPKILILQGEDDSIVSADKAWELHRLIKNSQMRLMRKVGHALPMLDAEICCKEILEHCQ